MLKNYHGKKLTPNQFAKLEVIDQLYKLQEGYWIEVHNAVVEQNRGKDEPTDKELAKVGECMQKLTERLINLLDPNAKITE